jgi:hypothetical protein
MTRLPAAQGARNLAVADTRFSTSAAIVPPRAVGRMSHSTHLVEEDTRGGGRYSTQIAGRRPRLLDQRQASPWRTACAAAAARVATPSLVRMLETWLVTVRRLTNRASAIC